MPKIKLAWTSYPLGKIFRLSDHKYILRVAKTISDLKPVEERVFSDHKLLIMGFYNKRGYCVGYTLNFKDNPTIKEGGFYLTIDYVDKDNKPKVMTFPSLKGKADSSIKLVKFGTQLKNRMYVFIYRRKQDV